MNICLCGHIDNVHKDKTMQCMKFSCYCSIFQKEKEKGEKQ